MNSRLEKITFSIIALICALGVWSSYYSVSFYQGFFEQVRGPLHVLTLIGLALAAFIFFYRSRVLRPFRGRGFLNSLFLQGLVMSAIFIEQVFWAVGLKRSPVIQVSLSLSFIYFCFGPWLYLYSQKIKNVFDRFAFACPQKIHMVLYLFLVALNLGLKKQSALELVEFSGLWLFILVIYSPLNRRHFSRVSLTR